MKVLAVVVLAILLFSCEQKTGQSTQAAADSLTAVSSNSAAATETSWVESFNTLRNAIYQGDRATVKKFFQLPIVSEGNEIWSVASDDNQSVRTAEEKAVPFEEKDFDRYYAKFFPKDFISFLLKVKAKELYSAGEFETKEIRDTSDNQISSWKLLANFNRPDKELSFTMLYSATIKEEDGEEDFGGESAVTYVFDILSDGHLRFKGMYLAG